VKKAKKPAASKNDVRAAVITVLEELGVAEQDALKRDIETHIVESGKSRMGLALRLKEVLAEERFIDTPAGYRLAEHESSASQEQPPKRTSEPDKALSE